MNPTHLFLGTIVDNRMDCVVKRRHAFGERNGLAKLTEAIIREIRSGYVFGSRESGTYALARQYRVNQALVHRIVTNQNWKHVR